MKKLISTILVAAVTASLSISAFAGEHIDKTEGSYNIAVNGSYEEGSSSDKKVSVDIIWTAMDFTYNAGSDGEWNADDHSYSNGTKAGWSDNKADITVKNHSNIAVTASFTFSPNTEKNVTTKGTFYTKGGESAYNEIKGDVSFELASAVGTVRNNDDDTLDKTPKNTISFGVSGDGISENVSLGNIVVSIAKNAK